MRYIAALDEGTTATRAVLFDLQSEKIRPAFYLRVRKRTCEKRRILYKVHYLQKPLADKIINIFGR